MRIVLARPESWPAAIVLEISALVPAPPPAELHALARLPPGVASATERTTDDGWAFDLFEADHEVVAIYRFLDHVGTAHVRATGGAALPDRAAVLTALGAARPDWRGAEVIALAQLWQPPPA
jgi:hypothetical protein